MTATTFPPRIRALIPVLASRLDGEALGACRAIDRTLQSAGLDFHELAAAIPVTADPGPRPVWDAQAWQAASRPAPPYRPSRRRAFAFTPAQTAHHRVMARYCREADCGRLGPREREFVTNIIGWRRELSIPQADWLAVITDRLEQEDR